MRRPAADAPRRADRAPSAVGKITRGPYNSRAGGWKRKRSYRVKVRQALGNVVRNAIEASSPGGVVRVEGAARDGWAEVAVTDHGPGVPERDRDAVFTPFFTTKEQGTGLGLAIAREFVQAHGGTLEVDGGPGRGATFMMRLPLSPPGEAAFVRPREAG